MIYVDNIPINITTFPDGTSQVWKLELPLQHKHNVDVVVRWDFENEAEVMHLVQLKDLLDQYFGYKKCMNLHMSYLPYARQDKDVCNYETFALKSFAFIINSLGFDQIECVDPHSWVAESLIPDLNAVYPTARVLNTYHDLKCDFACYPDKGARKKYMKIYDLPFIYGEKKRDPSTGYITDYKLFGNPKDSNILIIDDICDGGMTFIILAKDLLKAGAKSVNLFVTHGLFSKGIQVLKDAGISRIFSVKGEHNE